MPFHLAEFSGSFIVGSLVVVTHANKSAQHANSKH